MSENINWERKKELNFTKLLNKVEGLTKQLMGREINSIKSKIEVLAKMGLISNDSEQYKEMESKLKDLKLED